jgi:hypothetical protein
MYSLKFLEARSLNSVLLCKKQGAGRAMLAPEAQRESLFLASYSFWQLPEFFDSQQHGSTLCHNAHTAPSSSVCNLLLPFSYKHTWDSI